MPEDPLWDRARGFDRQAGFEVVDSLASFYSDLPQDPAPAAFVAQVQHLAGLLSKAAA